MKVNYKRLAVIIPMLLIFLSACEAHKDNILNSQESIKTVYVKENNNYEPYLVITDNYNGNMLLLRKYLCNEQIYFSGEKSHGSNGGYYPCSHIDNYLNTEFLSLFSHEMQEKIISSQIDVSALDSISGGGAIRNTEKISRKIFLLSATELNIKSGMALREGTPLKYFKDNKNVIAYTDDNTPQVQWLRSAYLWDDIQAWTIGCEGEYGGSSVSLEFYFRPAFCIDKNTNITENNQKYYIED